MAEPETEPETTVGSGPEGESIGRPPKSHGQSGRGHYKTPADAAQLLRVVLEALPPERPQDAATARRLEGAVLALELQDEPALNG